MVGTLQRQLARAEDRPARADRRSAACPADRGRRAGRASGPRSRRAGATAGGSSSSWALSSIVSSCRLSNAISRIRRPAASSVPSGAQICEPQVLAPARARPPRSQRRSEPPVPPTSPPLPRAASNPPRPEATGTSAQTRSGVLEREVDRDPAAHRAARRARSRSTPARRGRRAGRERASTARPSGPARPCRTRGRRSAPPGNRRRRARANCVVPGPRVPEPRMQERPPPGPRRRTSYARRPPSTSTNRALAFTCVEPRRELRVRLLEQLGQHPRLADHRHEVRVAAPPRNDVPVQVVGDPGAGDPAEVHPDVEPVRSRLLAQRAHRSLHAAPRSPRSPRGRDPRGRRRGATAATSRWPGVVRVLGERSTNASSSAREDHAPLGVVAAGRSQKTQPSGRRLLGRLDVLHPPRDSRAGPSGSAPEAASASSRRERGLLDERRRRTSSNATPPVSVPSRSRTVRRPGLDLLVADHQRVRRLHQLRRADLLADGLLARRRRRAAGPASRSRAASACACSTWRSATGHEPHLLRREPQRERAGVVLDQHGAEPLERPEDRAVDHHRAVPLVVLARRTPSRTARAARSRTARS